MRKYLVQVSLGFKFEDLVVTASDTEAAIQAAKILVANKRSLAIFKHRYTRYTV